MPWAPERRSAKTTSGLSCDSFNSSDVSVACTAPSAETWVFDMVGSAFDTVLSAYTDSTGAVELGSNYEGYSSSTSRSSAATTTSAGAARSSS